MSCVAVTYIFTFCLFYILLATRKRFFKPCLGHFGQYILVLYWSLLLVLVEIN